MTVLYEQASSFFFNKLIDDWSIIEYISLMKRSNKAESTRQHILEVSTQLVLKKGFVGVGIQEILTACAIPKGSFYYYFASKEQFGCVLLEHYIAQYKLRMAALWKIENLTAYARLIQLWTAWIDDPKYGGWAENCLIVKLAAEVADLSEEMRLILNTGVEKLTLSIALLIGECQKQGTVSVNIDALEMAKTLYQMWLGAALLAKLAKNKSSLYLALQNTEKLLQADA